MPQDDAECCGRCQYWILAPGLRLGTRPVDVGYCHYKAPAIHDYLEERFPVITATGWCGKWEPRVRQVITDVDPS